MMNERNELHTMSLIAKRGVTMLNDIGGVNNAQVIDCLMDIEHVHRVCPLNLDQFLAFDDGNFAHDFVGIYRHFNRKTLELENCFTPRCAKPE